MDVEEAWRWFASEVKKRRHPDSRIAYRPGAVADAAVIHSSRKLESGKQSREITVQIAAAAINAFREAGPQRRGDMLSRFGEIFSNRLDDGQYAEEDPPSPPFIVKVDASDLEP